MTSVPSMKTGGVHLKPITSNQKSDSEIGKGWVTNCDVPMWDWLQGVETA